MNEPDNLAALPPGPLSIPATAENLRQELASALEGYLTPLVAYCDAQREDDGLSTANFRHGFRVREALDAVLRYDAATEDLLNHYRTALAHAQQAHEQPVYALEQAIIDALSPAELLAYRQQDPIYRLGFARGRKYAAEQLVRVLKMDLDKAPVSPAVVSLQARVARFRAPLLNILTPATQAPRAEPEQD